MAWSVRKNNIERIDWHLQRKYIVLRALVPKSNEKEPIAAEYLYAALHGIYNAANVHQEIISFEVAAINGCIQFYFAIPEHLKNFVEGQIYAQYPTVEMEVIDDYSENILTDQRYLLGNELQLSKEDVYPIKTFVNFTVDPLASITSVLAEASSQEEILIQILIRPESDTWQQRGIEHVAKIKTGKDINEGIGAKARKLVGGIAKDVVQGIFLGKAPEAPAAKEGGENLPAPVEAALKGVEEKITKLGFESLVRIIVASGDEASASRKMQSLVGAFKQYNTNNLNSFIPGTNRTDLEILKQFQRRFFEKGYVLNIEELASLFHLPNISVETPRIVWAGSKKGEPPANLPLDAQDPDVTIFGSTNYRGSSQHFGIKQLDRSLHMYAIGKTGTGKSTLLENMIIDDIRKGRGVAVVDPHGDLIKKVLAFVPRERVEDVVIFDPSDKEYPIAFNILESVDPDLKNIIASGVVGIFKKIFGESWGPRLEYILRNAVLALLDYPGATMLGIIRILTDQRYRVKVVEQIKDPVIRDFFINEFEKYDEKFRTEAIAPIQNKVGQFLSSTTIRNIVGQSKSTINIESIMNNRKILLLDLSIGRIGEDNSALLGSMMITKMQLAAMGRANMPKEERIPFYLYVDEFQNFATDSFAVILSEARKYKLNLIMTNQYIAQMPETVANAVFGNIGTLVSFRVGASDASNLAQEFEPVFTANDLVNLDNYHIYTKMAIDGITSIPFSAKTLVPADNPAGLTELIFERSRHKYSKTKEEAEKEILTQSDYGENSDSLQEYLKSTTKKLSKRENIVEHSSGAYKKAIDANNARWFYKKTITEV